MPAAAVQTELPFLDLGNETRVNGDGSILSETEQPRFSKYNWLNIYVGDLFKNMGRSIATYVSDFKLSGIH